VSGSKARRGAVAASLLLALAGCEDGTIDLLSEAPAAPAPAPPACVPALGSKKPGPDAALPAMPMPMPMDRACPDAGPCPPGTPAPMPSPIPVCEDLADSGVGSSLAEDAAVTP
jgi:hypothetical protein